MSSTPQIVGVTVRLSKDEHDRLRALASAEQRSLNGEIRKAVRDHLERADEREAA